MIALYIICYVSGYETGGLMKRFITILLSAVFVLAFAGCASGNDSENSGESSHVSADVSQESPEPEPETRLKKCFGDLYEQEEYYISTDITVVSSASPESVSKYALTIAADNKNNAAMMRMTPSQGEPVHIVINDGFSYNINTETDTFTQQAFTDNVSSFTSSYTTELYLGITEGLVLKDTGEEEIKIEGSDKKQKLYYEKYQVTGGEEDSLSDGMTITYYFDGDTPKMEIMETSAGKTTFVFHEISHKINDRSIFNPGKLPAQISQ